MHRPSIRGEWFWDADAVNAGNASNRFLHAITMLDRGTWSCH